MEVWEGDDGRSKCSFVMKEIRVDPDDNRSGNIIRSGNGADSRLVPKRERV
jgi:hypothetical protein